MYDAATACSYSMQLQHAATACSYSMQLQHAATACSYSMQLQHAATACSYSMQLQHAATACSYSIRCKPLADGCFRMTFANCRCLWCKPYSRHNRKKRRRKNADWATLFLGMHRYLETTNAGLHVNSTHCGDRCIHR